MVTDTFFQNLFPFNSHFDRSNRNIHADELHRFTMQSNESELNEKECKPAKVIGFGTIAPTSE